MIYKLDPNKYDSARPIFAELIHIHLHIQAILQGDCRGELYVDDPTRPQTACIDAGEEYYLAGDPGNRAFNTALNARLPRDTYFVLFCDPDQWAGALDVVLKDTYAVRARRHYHQLQQLRVPNWQEQVPGGFLMQAFNPELLAQGLKNGAGIAEGILFEWPSQEAFFEQGFGFCLTHEGDIASWSLVDYVSGPRCEIGINTDWDYRRRGLGTLTAAANAAYAVAQGFASIGWHCWANNA